MDRPGSFGAMMRRVFLILVGFTVFGAACGGSSGTAADADVSGAASSVALVDSSAVPTPIETTFAGGILAPYDAAGDDPAVGVQAPIVSGSDILTGSPATTAGSGKPTAVAFFAHWCPHCRREVDEITAWLATNELPGGVDFVAISTFEDASRENHPPAAWLAGKGWPYPVIADTERFGVAEAFGATAVPFWVLVNADGTVALRLSGNLGPVELASLLEQHASASG